MKYLIIGLGNPGTEYEETRHNIGFKALDALAKASNVLFTPDRHGDIATLKFKGRTIILLKPSTFMNLSGKAVSYWMQKEKITLDRLLVITDDLALPFGTIRVRMKGSDGGHNGLKSIQETLGTNAYPRFRFGIGDEFSKGHQVNYVLSPWNEDELKAMPERLEKSCELIKSFTTIGLERTMNLFNNT
jgi:peptidyl-tRNA hydrolase, PTH1 family